MANLLLVLSAVSLVLTLCWGDMDCWDFLVSGPQGVPDSAISASSYHPYNSNGHHNQACSRLYMYKERASSGCAAPNIGAWCSNAGYTIPHIQVEFADLKKIVGVVVQQRLHPNVLNNNLRTYQVLYSQNGVDWEYVQSEGVTQTFYGPADSADENTEEHGSISPPVVARYIRIRALTWTGSAPTPPCLRFDVIGCTHVLNATNTRSRRFAYLNLPGGSISDAEVMTQGHAKHLGECSLRCHRDVTCRSFSYSDGYKDCKTYSVNKYSQLKSGAGVQSILDKQYLYFFDMTNVGLYMTTDPTTELIYKVITRRFSKEDAMTACAGLEMRLLVVNSVDKLNLLQRVTSSSLILEYGSMRVSGGLYEVDGVTKWWDGGDPPQPLNDELVDWDTTVTNAIEECLVYNTNALRRGSCTSELFSICEM
ncbi:uncharacterized protein LOC110456638 [Mizuhopecten yessoensis]|uniref:Hemocytin n=1 Tax=Mizuhopecten yessoensis TaxID=6573 RepID=A0A210QAL4_MIZYE|nr:uncharacterized protein LOC110456638 [Mizuhopecten yessoensis]OWF45772.1 Hemocytin [Mizuhopecten yessoensis]